MLFLPIQASEQGSEKWMHEMLHSENMVETTVCWYLQGNRIILGFLNGGAGFRPSTVALHSLGQVFPCSALHNPNMGDPLRINRERVERGCLILTASFRNQVFPAFTHPAKTRAHVCFLFLHPCDAMKLDGSALQPKLLERNGEYLLRP